MQLRIRQRIPNQCEFGATDVVTERGDEGVARIKELTHGIGADAYAHVHLHGGPAPVRRYLPALIKLVLQGKINPGKVFDLTLPLESGGRGITVPGTSAARSRHCCAPEYQMTRMNAARLRD